MAKKKTDWKVVCVALICLTALELYALHRGINGIGLTLAIAIIAGIAGYTIPYLLPKK